MLSLSQRNFYLIEPTGKLLKVQMTTISLEFLPNHFPNALVIAKMFQSYQTMNQAILIFFIQIFKLEKEKLGQNIL